MCLLWVTTAAMLPGAAAAGPLTVSNGPLGAPAAHCPPTAAQQVAQSLQQEGHRPQLHRLNQLPPASAYAAVLRRVNGCEAPVIIRYDIQESGGEAQE